MSGEGVGLAITPEFLRATATGIPLLLLAYWSLVAQGALWRRFIWRRAWSSLQGASDALGAPLVASSAGWRVAAGSVVVEWSGGWRGVRTTLRVGGRKQTADGLLDVDQVLQRITREAG